MLLIIRIKRLQRSLRSRYVFFSIEKFWWFSNFQRVAL